MANRTEFPVPAVILLDLKMPQMDGYEFLVWLRSQGDLKHIPTVVLSNSFYSADVMHAYQLGANAYLVKAGDVTELLTALQQFASFWLHLCALPSANATGA